MGSDNKVGTVVVTLDRASLDALEELIAGDTVTAREIVHAFVDDAPERVREIRDGVARGDHELARRAAHSLKSNAMTFGALELAAACRELEELARDGRLYGAEDLTARIDRECARALPAIRALTG